MTRRVVKVGGSLLQRNDLVASLSHRLEMQFLDSSLDTQSEAEPQSTVETLVVVGGGRLIDAIRELDQLRPGDPEAVHWTCVELLNATGRMLAGWFGWRCIESRSEFATLLHDGISGHSPMVVLPSTFYNAKHPLTHLELPHDWRTTTDSIAGLLACLTKADELVLLKSCEIHNGRSLKELAGDGILDEAMLGIEAFLPTVRVERLESSG